MSFGGCLYDIVLWFQVVPLLQVHAPMPKPFFKCGTVDSGRSGPAMAPWWALSRVRHGLHSCADMPRKPEDALCLWSVV